jgi:two-component system chemotaxis response regulator CheY
MLRKAISISGEPVGEIREAANGCEALGALADGPVDLVFTDLNMPRMGGVELVARMRADGALASIPVVVVSSERNATTTEALREQGVRAYVTKPFRPEEVREVLRGFGGGGAHG